MTVTVEYRTSFNFDSLSLIVYFEVSSLIDIRTKDYWAQYTLERDKDEFKTNYFVPEKRKI